MEQIQKDEHYTYEDYLTWPEGQRYELIDGIAYMFASPTLNHQTISGEVFARLWQHLQGKPCEVYHAPLDLRFAEDRKTTTVVQPDIMVVCEKEKMRPDGIVGAPTLIVEILSPGSINRDTLLKRNLYERNGVPEFWLISPQEASICQCVLKDGRYEDTLIENGEIVSAAIEGFSLKLDELFASIAE